MMEAIEVPGLHGMEAEMGVIRMVKEVEIRGESFKDVFHAAIYEEVGVSQYFTLLVMDQRLRGFLTLRGPKCPSCTFIGASDGLASKSESNY